MPQTVMPNGSLAKRLTLLGSWLMVRVDTMLRIVGSQTIPGLMTRAVGLRTTRQLAMASIFTVASGVMAGVIRRRTSRSVDND